MRTEVSDRLGLRAYPGCGGEARSADILPAVLKGSATTRGWRWGNALERRQPAGFPPVCFPLNRFRLLAVGFWLNLSQAAELEAKC